MFSFFLLLLSYLHDLLLELGTLHIMTEDAFLAAFGLLLPCFIDLFLVYQAEVFFFSRYFVEEALASAIWGSVRGEKLVLAVFRKSCNARNNWGQIQITGVRYKLCFNLYLTPVIYIFLVAAEPLHKVVG